MARSLIHKDLLRTSNISTLKKILSVVLSEGIQPALESTHTNLALNTDIDGILPRGLYPPCVRMADMALLAGYARYHMFRQAVPIVDDPMWKWMSFMVVSALSFGSFRLCSWDVFCWCLFFICTKWFESKAFLCIYVRICCDFLQKNIVYGIKDPIPIIDNTHSFYLVIQDPGIWRR